MKKEFIEYQDSLTSTPSKVGDISAFSAITSRNEYSSKITDFKSLVEVSVEGQ